MQWDYPACLPSIFVPLPFLSLIWCMCSSSDCFSTDEQLFTQSFYTVTVLLMKRTAVTRTTYYPVTLVPVHNFLCTCTMPILIQPKIFEFYSSLSHGAFWWTIFSLYLCESTLTVTCHIFTPLRADFPAVFASFLQSKFCGFVNLSLHI